MDSGETEEQEGLHQPALSLDNDDDDDDDDDSEDDDDIDDG